MAAADPRLDTLLRNSFYGIFAIGLTFRRPMQTVLVGVGMLCAIGLYLKPTDPIGLTYTSPLLLTFASGAGLGYLWSKCKTWPTWTGITLLLAGTLVTVALSRFENPPVAIRIVGAAAIVGGTIALEPWFAPQGVRSLRVLGDASYSLYLTHTLVLLLAVFPLARRIPLAGPLQFAVLILLSCTITIAVAVVVHLRIEKPIMGFLRGLEPANRKRLA